MTDAQTATAVRIARFGGPDVLEIAPVPIPQPLDDEVLVRVRAASINPVDAKMRSGAFKKLAEADLPVVLGRDLAGTIEAVGTRAHYMLRHGDRVFAQIGFDRGAQAEFAVVRATELVAMPAGLDFVAAAAVPLAGMTAWQGLFEHGALQPGQTVLIQGAAGGVGHLAVQFARAKGAKVIATCSGRDVAFVRDLGAQTVIDYRAERFEDHARDVDLVFDLVSGEVGRRSLAVLRPGGTYVCAIDAPDGLEAQGVRVVPRWFANPNAAHLGAIAALIEAGQVRVTVSQTFPLAAVAQAQARLAEGGVRGKIVLTLD